MYYRMTTALIILLFAQLAHSASEGVELYYREMETGIEPYLTRMSISDDFLRIDDVSEPQSSGYMLFDVRQKRIYSVSHADQSILVMDIHEYEQPKLSEHLRVQDVPLKDAPTIDGKTVRSYRVELKTDSISELCTSIQYVPNLLPKIGKVLSAWQQVLSANQVKILHRTPEQYRTPCMLSDQVYNRGEYYTRGLVIQEWHSNGKQRVLQHYQKQVFDDSLFTLPDGYEQFSLDDTKPLN